MPEPVKTSVFMGDRWVTRIVPPEHIEPAPKLCPRCKSLLMDGKHCTVNATHTAANRPKGRKRQELPPATFGTDQAAIVKASRKPGHGAVNVVRNGKIARERIAPPVMADTVNAGGTVITGKGEVLFPPAPLSGKVRGFAPQPSPVFTPTRPTSVQRAATAETTKRTRQPRQKSGNVSRVTRDTVGRAHRERSCDTCHSAIVNGECSLAAWHGKV